MLGAMWIALHLPVPRRDSCRGASPVYDPAHPFRSLGHVLRYVLRPTRSATRPASHVAKRSQPPEYAVAGVNRPRGPRV